jgi:hypothetical protein
MSDQTVSTPYGLMDRAALQEAQQSFDTGVLLTMVEQLDRFTSGAREQDGLRDQLLLLHRLAHTVINGSGLAGSSNETLPELATDILMEVSETVATLRTWLLPLEALQALAATD